MHSMTPPRHTLFTLPVLSALLATALLTGTSTRATDIEKADNTTALNLAGSYTAGGPPGTSDRILINSAMANSRSAALGANLSIDGILIDATATKILTINGTDSLTLGASGISILAPSGAGLIFNGPAITLGANQAWDFGSRGAQFTGATTFNQNGKTLAITTTGTLTFANTTGMSLDATISGAAGALTISGATLTLTNTNSTFKGASQITAGGTLSGSTLSATANSGSSTLGSGQLQVKGGTLQYTGNTATSGQNVAFDPRNNTNKVEVTTAGQTLTLSNVTNMNLANASLLANGLNLGGAGNLIITTKAIADSTNGQRTATALTKFGTGTLTLSVANTYTGATTINEGTLALSGAGTIHADSAITIAAGATFDTSAKTGAYAFSTATTTTVGVNATSAGLINSASVTFSSASLVLDFGSTSTLLSSYNIITKTGFTGDFANVTASGSSISGTFTLNNITKDWTLSSGGYDLTFSESLGTLTAVSAVPEPSSYATIFGALVLSSTMLRRRRVKSIG
jgi:fibronectin-binding autotransporter adhesin